ncbi:MAG TPA: M57 family metalloprotease, partial [Chitinophaga sp.]|nr:M57 family metalloprotease [Chitinophaga sp.]
IQEFKDYYMVQGDIMFDKKATDDHDVHTEQAMSDYLVVYGMRTINVYLAGGFSSINLDGPLNTAIAAYNALGSGLQFVRVYTQAQANISIVRNNNIGTNVCGSAGFPSTAGRPYGTVNISETTLTTYGLTSASQLTFLLAHEIGHCIGLRHTNWQSAGESSAYPVAGTPSTDGSSVMNGSTCGNSWNGFSYYDQVAIQTMYTTPAAGVPSSLSAGQSLGQGGYIRSDDYRFTLVLQGDGNLVLYHFNQPIWHSNTWGNPQITQCVMQGDGNLVLYDNNGAAYWDSQTYNYPGASLHLQSDGNLVIYQNGVARWASNTCCR